MKKLQSQIEISEFENAEALADDDLKLLNRAKDVLHHAYAPYSEFRVAAAVLLTNGEVVTGTNQENAAYPNGLCAERVAVFSASSRFPDERILKVAITASSERLDVDHPIAPCGSCRQVMLEYELKQKAEISLILAGESGKAYQINGIYQLLPIFFHEEGLKKHP